MIAVPRDEKQRVKECSPAQLGSFLLRSTKKLSRIFPRLKKARWKKFFFSPLAKHTTKLGENYVKKVFHLVEWMMYSEGLHYNGMGGNKSFRNGG
jgi:hypothetical protein